MHDFLSSPLEFLKGVGPQRAELLGKELGVFTFGDLLHHYPFRYVDRTRFYTIREISADIPIIQIKGKIRSITPRGEKRKKYLSAVFYDETGSLELKWFKGLRWITSSLRLNTEYVLFGKPTLFNGNWNIIHPELELVSEGSGSTASALQPVYNTTEKMKARGLDSRGLMKLQKTLLEKLPENIPETLPDELITQLRMISGHRAIRHIHFPGDIHQQKMAEWRIKFEELFYLQLRLLNLKIIRKQKNKGAVFKIIGDHFNRFFHHVLPFELTHAQKRVIREIRADFSSGRQMNRLLQGDVGSGKTLVALMCMLIAADNGFQACLMAPTEILAAQHAATIAEFLSASGLKSALLTGSIKGRQRREILAELESGEIHILIGTHAIIEDAVKFHNLGFVVIDEQHRFGVEQRARMWDKNENPPHVLVMTATPIPRTLAMTLYGDLDVSILDEMPPGRKPIHTIHRLDSHRLEVWGFLKKEIASGRQVYIVYPLIEESEKMDLKNLFDGYEAVCRDFPAPEYRVSIVHGRMKASDKDFEMQRFLKKETNIMVATSVIEVGVNIPNASVMVIENAERFGLSQLHQLRGRVGRGSDQSYCILMTGYKLSHEGRTRIKTMCETNDGFRIAETDLLLRGPGDAEGTRQSGMLDLKLADISRDQSILQAARTEATKILQSDPLLNSENHRLLKSRLDALNKRSGNWGKIS